MAKRFGRRAQRAYGEWFGGVKATDRQLEGRPVTDRPARDSSRGDSRPRKRSH